MTPADNEAHRPESQDVKGVVTQLSPWSVEDSIARLSEILAARGVKLFAVIDQKAEAEAVGLQLRETRLAIFGSPKAGTPVMDAAPLAALDLPLKVVVWQDGDQTKISYTDAAELAARYHLSDDLAKPLGAAAAIVNAVIEQ